MSRNRDLFGAQLELAEKWESLVQQHSDPNNPKKLLELIPEIKKAKPDLDLNKK